SRARRPLRPCGIAHSPGKRQHRPLALLFLFLSFLSFPFFLFIYFFFFSFLVSPWTGPAINWRRDADPAFTPHLPQPKSSPNHAVTTPTPPNTQTTGKNARLAVVT